MSLLKPKKKYNTWSQIKRRLRAGHGHDELEGNRNLGVKSQPHLQRITRRTLRRIARKDAARAAV